jgi:hypothetical protein
LTSTPVFKCPEEWVDQTHLNRVVWWLLTAHVDLATDKNAARF